MGKLDGKQTEWHDQTLFNEGYPVIEVVITLIFDGPRGRAHGVFSVAAISKRTEQLDMAGGEIEGNPSSPAVLQWVQNVLATAKGRLQPF